MGHSPFVVNTPQKSRVQLSGSKVAASRVDTPSRSTASKATRSAAVDIFEDDVGSPPPTLTPSKARRIWPLQYTNKGIEEAERLQRTPDPVVASPQSMMGRLASAAKPAAPRFRLGIHGVEPVHDRGVSLKDVELIRPTPSASSQRKSAPVRPSLRIEESEQAMLRAIVLDKITSKRPIPLVGLDSEYTKVYQVAEQTVTAGEGNSMLVIGARGSGKTALVDKAVREIARDHGSDFHVIRLNGFIHTDDKLALREIWRQLGREMEVEDDGTGKSYADTLARLLALLSSASELAGHDTEYISKAVIFIMDEFDLFASHPRQTLLYNLFDIAQSRKAPVAVFGLTTRIDVAEGLEKRVKSRFSHRYVHLCQAPNLPGILEVCRAALSVETEELQPEEKARLLPASKAGGEHVFPNESISSLRVWNATVNALLQEQHFLIRYITPHLYLSKSIPTILSNLHLPIALAAASSLPLNPTHFDLDTASSTESQYPAQLLPPDSNLHLLSALPTLTLSLLIAAARSTIIHDTPLLNFQIAYAEYSSLASKARIASASSGALASGTRVWGKEVARSCWEELVRLKLLVPAQGGADEGTEAEVGEKGMVRVDVALEEIVPSCAGMEKGPEKWCKQI